MAQHENPSAQINGLISQARPDELQQLARFAIEMTVSASRAIEARNQGIGHRFTAASHKTDYWLAQSRIRQLVQTHCKRGKTPWPDMGGKMLLHGRTVDRAPKPC